MDVRSRQGETVDAICYRIFGRTAGIVERVLSSNNGLADIGPVLPNGTLVHLPAPADAQPPKTHMVQLWS